MPVTWSIWAMFLNVFSDVPNVLRIKHKKKPGIHQSTSLENISNQTIIFRFYVNLPGVVSDVSIDPLAPDML